LKNKQNKLKFKKNRKNEKQKRRNKNNNKFNGNFSRAFFLFRRNKLNSASEFPSLPGAPPGLNLHPKSATLFNRKAFTEQDFPSLPMGAPRPPPGIKFEDVEKEDVQEEEPQNVGKKGKKQQKKVVLRWG
jgi:hypothetical protein